MPGRDHPNEVAKPIFAVLDDKGDEPSVSEANDPILFGVIVSPVFDIGQREYLIEPSKIDLSLC
jgi:hypothetical protein